MIGRSPALPAMVQSRRIRRVATIAGAVLVSLVAGGYGLRELANARRFQLFGDLVARVDTSERVVALTFDDGPMAGSTEAVLAALARHRVKATFFLVGESIEAHPDQARAIAAAGHQIGNHSHSHQRMVFKSPSFIRSEVERADAAIASTGYRGEVVFRPPFGKKLVYLPCYLGRRGVPTIMWDVEPDSDLHASAEEIVRRTVDQVRPGSIILLHVMVPARAESLRAVEPIVVELTRRGYRFVTVSELLALR
jgi:peptidoglycan/xylan/chitin deacetylase (PgdA/CDA1 family)